MDTEGGHQPLPTPGMTPSPCVNSRYLVPLWMVTAGLVKVGAIEQLFRRRQMRRKAGQRLGRGRPRMNAPLRVSVALCPYS